MSRASDSLLARWSAISFPAMPEWPRIHISISLHLVVSLLRAYRHSATYLELKTFALSALSATKRNKVSAFLLKKITIAISCGGVGVILFP
jgi:hypothetical protein